VLTFSQILLAVSIPTFVALVGVVWNQVSLGEIRAEIRGMRKDFHDEVTGLLKLIHSVDIRVVKLEERK
jgi:hypothetical protein